ncbi:hypothetical protein DFO67_1326 [Modicisalibacter xianhensis]|uniref:Uncharacterized protein n=1 Tax=Modicisalibacter xianhensis TaxID=442341 RepID=A0A4R8FGB6_9GAMM|nr:hypothetical protein [Halomonas xianhensis]TDX21887.1 hypothetical protein DFO67_1326 [Halomonas xianhensis]
MSQLLIEGFKYGLDRRKSRFTSAPGTLIRLENAHITAGGELEKRKAYAQYADLPAGTHGLLGGGETIYVFGSADLAASVTAKNVTYHRLNPGTGINMTEVKQAVLFDGKPFVIAAYDDGIVRYWYDGAQCTGISFTSTGTPRTTAQVATALADDFKLDDITVSTASNVVSLESTDAFDVSLRVRSSTGDTLTGVLSSAVTQQAASAYGGAQAEAEFRILGTLEGYVHGLSVNSTQLLVQDKTLTDDSGTTYATAAIWCQDNPNFTAVAVTDAINANTATSGYEASTYLDIVKIRPTAIGSAINGTPVDYLVGPRGAPTNASSGVDMTPFAGGEDAVAAQPQITEVTVSALPVDTYDAVYEVQVSRDGGILDTASALHIPNQQGHSCTVFKNKVHAVNDSILYTSALNDPSAFEDDDTASPPVIGSDAKNVADNIGGNSNLYAVGRYQDSLAIFARNSSQIYFVDVDPQNDTLRQTLDYTGTLSPNAVVPYGDLDVFYLSGSGVRSLRAKDSSNAAYSTDVGSPIDDLLRQVMLGLPRYDIERACALIEPTTGRFMLALGDTVYVYSWYPAADVQAWSTYKPGFVITAMTVFDNRVYVRSGNTIYLYGGRSGQQYDAAKVVVETPYMGFSDEGAWKMINGLSIAADGEWSVTLKPDPSNEATESYAGRLSGVTYNGPGFHTQHRTTHLAIRLENEQAGRSRLLQMTFYFAKGQSR